MACHIPQVKVIAFPLGGACPEGWTTTLKSLPPPHLHLVQLGGPALGNGSVFQGRGFDLQERKSLDSQSSYKAQAGGRG